MTLFLGASAGAWEVVGQSALIPVPGFYEQPVTITLPPGVHYTLDGSTPTIASPEYLEPVFLTETTVVRYAAFDTAGKRAGFVAGGTYFINAPETRLLTLSIGIDPWRLFGKVEGWFLPGPGADPDHWKQPGANWWTRKEHPMHLDVLETDGELVYSSTVGFRMFGGMSRLHPQKSFSISARKQYGKKRIKHRLFGPEGPKSFQFLVVRNSGSDWNRSYLRDALLTDLLQDDSWDLDRQSGRPTQVYINGKYWGVYHLREKINAQFLADRHDVEDKDGIDLLEHQQTVKHGRFGGYQQLLRFVEQHNLSDQKNYEQLKAEMDVDNFQRFQIAQTYFDNRDAGGNIRYWRDRNDPQSRWRWILYDVDQGFGLHSDTAYVRNTLAFYTEPNGPSWPNPPWSTFLQRKLLNNPDYRRSYVNRSLDYLHTDFAPEVVSATIERHVARLEFDMPRQLARWKGKDKNWRLHLQRLRNFARERPRYLREYLREYFVGGADVPVTITAGPGGAVALNNNLRITGDRFSGRYFQNHPLHLRACPKPGYQFVGWTGIVSDDESITLDLQDGKSKAIVAEFAAFDHPLAGQVVFTEICPKSENSGDWLEVFNRSAAPVDLTGWQLSDGEHTVVLPAATVEAGDYLVICEDLSRFKKAHPAALNAVAGLGFGLKQTGETLSLFGPRGGAVNQVAYAVEAPDTSFVVALVRPGLDNTDARHWSVKPGPGTPGTMNPEELRSSVLTKKDYWSRIGFGGGVMALVLLVLIVRGRRE